jgi:hypothetical protein
MRIVKFGYTSVEDERAINTAQRTCVIPEGAVVVQGSRQIHGAIARRHGIAVYSPVSVKQRGEKTDAATALEESLR